VSAGSRLHFFEKIEDFREVYQMPGAIMARAVTTTVPMNI
jgi:hypothetical protein